MKTEAIAGIVVVVLGSMATGAYVYAQQPTGDVICYGNSSKHDDCYRAEHRAARCIETACTLGVISDEGIALGHYYASAKCECSPGAHLSRDGTVVTCRCDAPDAGSGR